jgi:DNA polymerase sigma
MWYLLYVHSLTAIAKEVFGEAEVLPFGSSGNGLALANADMDVCVFLNTPEGSAEVLPVEFVERLGDRLEKDSEFENILQLKRARVPIVKLNHINGIACDIGYRNDLAIWNTRLLRAYTRIDDRMRDMVTVIKTWAKRRKINNPYTGSLSRYVCEL